VLRRLPDGSYVGGVVDPLSDSPPKWGRPVDRDRWRDLRIGDRVTILLGDHAGKTLTVTEFAG